MALLNNTIVNGILRANVGAFNTIRDVNGSAGTSGYILTTTGTTIQWKAVTDAIATVTSTKAGLAPAASTENSFFMRVGSAAAPTWATLTIINGGSASTTG